MEIIRINHTFQHTLQGQRRNYSLVQSLRRKSTLIVLIKRRRTWRRPRHVFSSVWIVDGVWVDHKATQTLPSLEHLLYISQQPTEELSFSYTTMLRKKTIYTFCKSTPFLCYVYLHVYLIHKVLNFCCEKGCCDHWEFYI